MELSVAVNLINQGMEQNNHRQVWADLGAGDGLFTEALSTLLTDDSVIYAVDKKPYNYSALKKRAALHIHSIQHDFTTNTHFPEKIDGVLMANALHFVKDKPGFIHRLINDAHPKTIVLVEYDTDIANTWVPYPMRFSTLRLWAQSHGFPEPVKIGSASSQYQDEGIYSAAMRW